MTRERRRPAQRTSLVGPNAAWLRLKRSPLGGAEQRAVQRDLVTP